MDDRDLSAEQTLGKLLLLVNNLQKVVEDLIFRGGRLIFFFSNGKKNKSNIYFIKF